MSPERSFAVQRLPMLFPNCRMRSRDCKEKGKSRGLAMAPATWSVKKCTFSVMLPTVTVCREPSNA